MGCYKVGPDGVVLAVRVTPKAAEDAVDGVGRLADGTDVVMARVRAPPAKGAANAALVVVLAKALKLPKRSVTVVSGGGSRLKRVLIAGNVDSLPTVIEQWPKLE
jgi:uncharacterized protein